SRTRWSRSPRAPFGGPCRRPRRPRTGGPPMFAEAIRALEVFAADATGWPTRVGAALNELPAKAGETTGGGTSAQSRIRPAAPDRRIHVEDRRTHVREPVER